MGWDRGRRGARGGVQREEGEMGGGVQRGGRGKEGDSRTRKKVGQQSLKEDRRLAEG
jgi:hypothetical protein